MDRTMKKRNPITFLISLDMATTSMACKSKPNKATSRRDVPASTSSTDSDFGTTDLVEVGGGERDEDVEGDSSERGGEEV